MQGMFYNNTVFDQGSIGGEGGVAKWDTSDVQNMSYMFGGSGTGASISTFSDGTTNNAVAMQCVFNQDITEWETGNVTQMRGMFQHTKYFNQDIGTNGLAKLVDGTTDFDYTFNSSINSSTQGNDYANTTRTDDYWDVSKVTMMDNMFLSADAFQIPLTNWDMEALKYSANYNTQGDMFLFSVYNTANYDLLLKDWQAEMGTASRDNDDCNFGISTRYTKNGDKSASDPQECRHNLIKDHNWRFHDASKTNYSIHFDGSNDYLTASATPVFGQVKYSDTSSGTATTGTLTNGAGTTITSNSSPGDWSITFFFKADDLNNSRQVLFHFGQGASVGTGADNIKFLIHTDNKLRFESDSWSHSYAGSATISEDTWYSVIYRVDRSGNAGWLINGADAHEMDISSISGFDYTSAGTSYMGCENVSGVTNFFEGNIDLVYIYYGYLNVTEGLAAVAAGGEWDGRVYGQPNSGDSPYGTGQAGVADGVYPGHSWLMGDNRTWRKNIYSSARVYPTGQGPKNIDGSGNVVIPHNVFGTMHVDDGNDHKWISSYPAQIEFILGTSSDGHVGTGIEWTSSGMTVANIVTDTPDY
jgi:hypothetical protein